MFLLVTDMHLRDYLCNGLVCSVIIYASIHPSGEEESLMLMSCVMHWLAVEMLALCVEYVHDRLTDNYVPCSLICDQ
eukprot:55330-Eustigmatos_ZCMA.PRE.1